MMTFDIEKETGKTSAVWKIPPYMRLQHKAIAKVDPDEYSDKVFTQDQLPSEASNALGVPMQCPLWMKREEDAEYWLLPYEAIITIHGKNIIAKKQVAKGKVRGSIKERWAQDDYQVNISGILMAENGYPEADVKKLRTICEATKVQVMSPIFELFSIDRLVIESFDFPFTSGPGNQAYTIGAVSDDIYKLLLRKEDLKSM